MKKTIKKMLIIVSLSLCIFSLMSSNIYASSISDIVGEANNFINVGDPGSAVETDKIKEMSEILYNTLLIIGIIVAVIVGMIIGIKFMTEGVAEKAKLKETFIAYIAGCVVVFGAFTIWKIVVTILQSTG